jgi:hypothetical protein
LEFLHSLSFGELFLLFQSEFVIEGIERLPILEISLAESKFQPVFSLLLSLLQNFFVFLSMFLYLLRIDEEGLSLMFKKSILLLTQFLFNLVKLLLNLFVFWLLYI